jgi:hypothetical protein
VTVDGNDIRRLRGDDLDGRVGVERRDQVDDASVELAGDGVLREARPDALRESADGRALRDLEGRPVGQPDRHVFRQHVHVLSVPQNSFRKKRKRG